MKYRSHVFWIKTATHRGGPYDIEEQHRDQSQRFVAAARRIKRVQTLAKRRQCHVDDGVSKQRALRLQRGDRCLNV